MKNPYLIELLKDAAQTAPLFENSFGKLSAEQLNWKPNPETWSIGECIDHIITTNRSYFAQLEALARGDKHVSFWEKLPLFHGMWGRMLVKMTGEIVGKKVKSPSAFKPTRSTVSHGIVSEFAAQHRDMIEKIKKTDVVDHYKTMITSPGASFITYSLHDGCVIVFQHEKRHYRQAKALMERAEFPKQ